MNRTTTDLLDIFRSAAAEVSISGEVPDLGPDAALDELGFDSVQLAELLATMEEQVGVRAEQDALYQLRTVGDLVGVLGDRDPA